EKARTLLTAFAGSIGIIGIALILSLSHGFQSYIDTVQEQTLSSYPLTIEANPVDMSGMLSAMSGAKDDSADAHDLDKVYANTVMYSMLNSMVSSATGQSNNLPEFKKYLENPDNKIHDYISGIQYTYDMGFAVYTEDPNGTVIKADTTELLQNVMKSMYGGDYSSYFDSMGGFYSGFNVWQELLSGEDGALVS
ncbi:ABC transporter ATP-binding protein, partial [human gut metagenome]